MRYSSVFFLAIFFFLISCEKSGQETGNKQTSTETSGSLSILVLGTIQDAGSPQIGCQKDCCINLYKNPDPDRMVVSLGVVDRVEQKTYLLEAAPDMPRQVRLLQEYADFESQSLVDGIFLTHAHIGHYTGLMYLGKEAMDADSIPVFAMPGMSDFLQSNGPWDQLVKRGNIQLAGINNDQPVYLSENLQIIPFLVPHRDEYSETVGFKITGPNKSALFIPDIDKWEKWERSIEEEIANVDYAFLDATFYSGTELGNRDMSQIPHPSIEESMQYFSSLSAEEKAKVYFIHFNHTNPVLDSESEETKEVLRLGFNIASTGDVFNL